MSASNVSFAHGVASGDPYADSVILWTRISPPDGLVGSLDGQWQIATSADFAPGSIKGSGSFSTSAARDWTVKVEAAGLSADTSYFYRFSSGTTVSAVGQTKTLPAGSDPVRLAVFSCSNFTAAQRFDAYARAAAINSANPYDAWLHLGDYIYEYGAGGYGAAEDAAGSRGFLPNREILSLGDYRQRYAQYHTDAGLQALRAAAPLIAGWDDHETANNSWSGGAENHQSASEGDWIARRDAALKAYYEWIPIREPGQRQPSDGASALSPLTQAYRSFHFGDVLSLHMLETRLTARDEQLAYPDAATVQGRIGAILADPALVASYATKAGIAPPASQAATPAFANALAPLVTQELVLATVQQAWGDPSRDLIGDSQLAWLQQRMAGSSAAWQVLGQQVLMQSMALPSELLLAAQSLNLNDPASAAKLTATLDRYAAPLQKLATGTLFASLSAAEQALFAEAGKIPYNLDSWDGYGVERETILQTAQALGKRLISLAGDTHNAWAGVLDTMSAGTQPAGTVAGVEFATPGVTAPGFEKNLPGADAYIRARFPAVDGLDGLFKGYVNGLKYADLNRRGFLDLTVSKEQAVGTFQLLNGTDPLSGKPLWSSETVASSASFALSTSAEARPLISWQPLWQELDLNFGLAFDATGAPTPLDPAAYASVPRDGVQLADVRVLGSPGADRVVVGAGASVEAGAGTDELDNTDSQGGNVLAGGTGTDQFLLRAAADTVIGGELLANASSLGLPAVVGLVDGQRDLFLIDSSNPAPEGTLRILDYELGIDELLLDGVAQQTPWLQTRSQLQSLNVEVNAAPRLIGAASTFTLKRGLEVSQDLASLASDPDPDSLSLVKLEGPSWITTSGTSLQATAPNTFTQQDLAALTLKLAFSDGKALAPFSLPLALFNGPPTTLSLRNTVTSLAETTGTTSRIKVADIVISDDGLGTNTISLTGADAAAFELVGAQLFLKAQTSLDFETKRTYALTISVSDPSLPASTPLSTDYSLSITDVNEDVGVDPKTTFASITLPTGESRSIPISLTNGDLASGSNLLVIREIGINPSDLTTLAQLGVTTHASGLDFQLTVDQTGDDGARASLSALLELVAADIMPELTNPSGARRPDRKLLFYGVNATGDITPLTYDPITGAGARFFDLNNDGTADFFTLSLIDGGYGDKDGIVNGVIDDPSVAGFVDLTNLQFTNAGSGTLTVSDPTNAAPAAVNLRASLTGRPTSANQIGYVVLNASEVASADSLLSDLTWLRGRARTLFSSLESSDVTLPGGIAFDRDIQLINGQSIRFFEVVDASLDQLSSLADSRFRFLTLGAFSNAQAGFSSSSGVRFGLSLLPGDPGLNALVGTAQGLAPVLDLSAFTTAQSISGTLVLGREADFNTTAGFYRSLDATGTVLAADGITLLTPGDNGYAAAALRSSNLIGQLGGLSVADNQTSARSFSGVGGGSFLAPFAQVNGNTFFAYAAANSDGISHFRTLGNNLFGLEDILGGGDLDYDDLVIGFNVAAVV